MSQICDYILNTEVRSLLAWHKAAARNRQLETLSKLRGEIETIMTGERIGGAILTKGSLARGDFCRKSDVDLVILANADDETAECDLTLRLISLGSSLGRRVSVDWWNHRTDVSRSRSIGFWLAMIESRMLAGDLEFFHRCRSHWIEKLFLIPVPTLFELRRLDLRRHWDTTERYSALSMNVKRGEGGLIDSDFLALLRDFSGADPRRLLECQTLFETSRSIGDHLFLIKSLLHDITGEPRESALLDSDCSPLPCVLQADNVRRLMDVHQEVLETLKEKLPC